MPQRLTNFDLMWSAYPNPGGSAEATKSMIGAGANASWITNTCVVRVSRSFNYAGFPVPKQAAGMKTVKGADGMFYAFRIREFRKYMIQAFGKPTLQHNNVAAGGPVPEAFHGRRGLIGFTVQEWTDASGHIDLWDGAQCRHKAYFHKASTVELWEIAERKAGQTRKALGLTALTLTSSVGEGGKNLTADAVIVQTLLAENGHALRIDGICNADTIAAIRAFQGKAGREADGRVDPGGGTLRALNGG